MNVVSINRGFLYSVVLWSDSVGDIHMWSHTLWRSTCHESPDGATERNETGETQQYGMP